MTCRRWRGQRSREKDRPFNGTSARISAGIFDLMGGRGGWYGVPRHPISGSRKGCPRSCSGVFLLSAQSLSESGRLAASLIPHVQATACGRRQPSINRIDDTGEAGTTEVHNVPGVELGHSVALQRHGKHEVVGSPSWKRRGGQAGVDHRP